MAREWLRRAEQERDAAILSALRQGGCHEAQTVLRALKGTGALVRSEDGKSPILHHNGRVVTDLETVVEIVKRDLVPEMFNGPPARSRAGGPADSYEQTIAELGAIP